MENLYVLNLYKKNNNQKTTTSGVEIKINNVFKFLNKNGKKM